MWLRLMLFDWAFYSGPTNPCCSIVLYLLVLSQNRVLKTANGGSEADPCLHHRGELALTTWPPLLNRPKRWVLRLFCWLGSQGMATNWLSWKSSVIYFFLAYCGLARSMSMRSWPGLLPTEHAQRGLLVALFYVSLPPPRLSGARWAQRGHTCVHGWQWKVKYSLVKLQTGTRSDRSRGWETAG
jgi:hypothetical protein